MDLSDRSPALCDQMDCGKSPVGRKALPFIPRDGRSYRDGKSNNAGVRFQDRVQWTSSAAVELRLGSLYALGDHGFPLHTVPGLSATWPASRQGSRISAAGPVKAYVLPGISTR